MNDSVAPGSWSTVTGGARTVVGAIADTTGSANRSLPTICYGIPIFLGGLALKASELPPAVRITPMEALRSQREAADPELGKLVNDVTRWRYGQKAHLETSLEALKLWDDANPPQLEEIEELDTEAGYGLRMRFQLGAVSLERWTEREARLGRFFAKGLRAEIKDLGGDQLDLLLLPVQAS